MKVSIITPAYNAAAYLAETLRSVQAQTMTDWELVVVNDGSTDDTAAIAQEFAAADARIRVLSRTNGGVAAARNTGISAISADAPYVAFIDSDDVWQPDALEVLRTALESAPGATAVSGLTTCMDQQGRPTRIGQLEAHQRSRRGVKNGRLVDWPDGAPITFAVLAFWNYIITPGQVLIRRSALDAAGLFDTKVIPAEDYDMWLRLAQRGDIAVVDRVVIAWRSHSANASSQTRRMALATLAVRRKHMRSREFPPETRRVAAQGCRYDSLVKLSFAAASLLRGRVEEAGRELARAGVGYARYLRARYA